MTTITDIRPGKILIAQGFWNNEIYNRAVVLILDKDDFGTTGIIINKPSSAKVNEVFDNVNHQGYLKYGGPYHPTLIGFLHKNKHLKDAVMITEELYWCGDMELLKANLSTKAMLPEEVQFVAGFVEWKFGELEWELEQKKWWIDDMDADELFCGASASVLWAYHLIRKGNNYGILHEVEDPVLN